MSYNRNNQSPDNLNSGRNQQRRSQFLRWLPWIIGLVILVLIIYFAFFYSPYKNINFSTFLSDLQGGKIKDDKRNQIVVQVINGILTLKGVYYTTGGTKVEFFTSVVNSQQIQNLLFGPGSGGGLIGQYFGNGTISFTTSTFNWLTLIVQLLPLIVIIIIAVFFFRYLARQRGAGFLDNRKFNSSTGKKISFNDVAGYIEEKTELKEITGYLANPRRFAAMGINVPRGVMLVGPPGTGKTFLARAVAGEAKVPFYNISASEFVELYVGVGASRIRELFKKARATAPCIVYIDELDAVGRHRGTGLGGGNDEREQTLNQLLVELDGFSNQTGVIVMASTNRIDVLDPALLRPGRFDRIVTVHLPTLSEREQILKIHASNKNCDPKINWRAIARRTPGFSGAQLQNILNEAAIMALRHERDIIFSSDIDEAIDRVLGGPEKKSRVYTEKEKWTVSYHESGHALIGLVVPEADQVEKITIIPRGNAGGYTMMLPKDETFLLSKKELYCKIVGYLGGRASEEILFGADNITTGASDDIAKATSIARKMVTELGMSPLGAIKFEEETSNPFLGKEIATQRRTCSEELSNSIDKEIHRIIDICYERAKKLILENRDLLDILAKSLFELEILTSEQIEYIVKNKTFPPEYHRQKDLDKKEVTRLKKQSDNQVFKPKPTVSPAYDPAKSSSNSYSKPVTKPSNLSTSKKPDSQTVTKKTAPKVMEKTAHLKIDKDKSSSTYRAKKDVPDGKNKK